METSPHCFTCREHIKIGREQKQCYCMANYKYTGKKELIKEPANGVCRSWISATRWNDKIDNNLLND